MSIFGSHDPNLHKPVEEGTMTFWQFDHLDLEELMSVTTM